MAKKKAKSTSKPEGAVKLIASNPSAKRNYMIEEVVEAGLVLTGTEIKSLRDQSPNLKDSYVEIRASKGNSEAWLLNAYLAPYQHGNVWNHDPLRKRKLLLHRQQIHKLQAAIQKKGLTVVPTRMYFKRGIAKAELGLGRGKKIHDKRDTIKTRDTEREMGRALKRSR